MAWDINIPSFTGLPSTLGLAAGGSAPSGWSAASGVLTIVTSAVDYYSYVGPADSADRTVEVEAKVNGDPGGGGVDRVFGQWFMVGNQTRYIDVGLFTDRIRVNDNGTDYDQFVDMTVWRKVRCTLAGTTFKLYVDNVLIYTRTVVRTFANSTFIFGQGTAASSGNWNVRALRINQSTAIAPTAPTTAYSREVLADSPLFAWPLDDPSGTAARDVSGNGNPGTISGGVTLGTAGPAGLSAMTFDGTSGYLSRAINLSALSTLTVEAWVSWDDNTNDGVVWEYTPNSNTGAGGNPAGFYLYNAGDGSIYQNLGPSWPTNIKYHSAPAINTWHHFVCIYDYTQGAAGEVKQWMDGIPVTLTDSGTQADHSSAQTFANDVLYVMARAGGSLFGKGKVAWVAAYAGALSPTRIAAHRAAMLDSAYALAVLDDNPDVYWKFEDASGAASALDTSGHGRNGPLVGSITFADPAVYPTLGTSKQFGGGSAAVELPYDSGLDVGTGDFTMEFVIDATGSGYRSICGKSNGSGSLATGVIADTTSHAVRFYVAGSALVGSVSILDGNPHHVVVTRISGVAHIYVDGVADGSGAAAANTDVATSLNTDAIGQSGDFNPPIGDMGHFAYYKTGLSSTQVANHYSALTATGLHTISVGGSMGMSGTLTKQAQKKFAGSLVPHGAVSGMGPKPSPGFVPLP